MSENTKTGYIDGLISVMPVVVAVLAGLGMTILSKPYLPNWLWQTDACPNKELVCGVMPPIGFVSAIVGVVIATPLLIAMVYYKGGFDG